MWICMFALYIYKAMVVAAMQHTQPQAIFPHTVHMKITRKSEVKYCIGYALISHQLHRI